MHVKSQPIVHGFTQRLTAHAATDPTLHLITPQDIYN